MIKFLAEKCFLLPKGKIGHIKWAGGGVGTKKLLSNILDIPYVCSKPAVQLSRKKRDCNKINVERLSLCMGYRYYYFIVTSCIDVH